MRREKLFATGSFTHFTGMYPHSHCPDLCSIFESKAAALCRHCPVLTECGAYALDNRVEFGIWGGMTERQRRALLAAHPGVRWSERFTARHQR
ncbi:hypothetical protein RW1_094_01980 [Rhodococcus wratislaviensis NBRC 100605]|uniref:4Fe-4S Wbl-type domain-containing protein n=1 Tax=Rhodococcus wratislaviensis NBRC 100605 TaxID=1219028 RepID=X0Q257_RHOWR|nr:hypothetical protein RW1_094_01980 [Rhodococcus wratislaviensis NBRC 100605]